MVNPVVFWGFRVGRNVVLHVHILVFKCGPYLMCNFPSQLVVTFYSSSSAAYGCRACSFIGYFTPKLLTNNVKLIGRLSCVNIPGVLLEGSYP